MHEISHAHSFQLVSTCNSLVFIVFVVHFFASHGSTIFGIGDIGDVANVGRLCDRDPCRTARTSDRLQCLPPLYSSDSAHTALSCGCHCICFIIFCFPPGTACFHFTFLSYFITVSYTFQTFCRLSVTLW